MSLALCSNCAGAVVDAQLRSTTTHLITNHRSDISIQTDSHGIVHFGEDIIRSTVSHASIQQEVDRDEFIIC